MKRVFLGIPARGMAILAALAMGLAAGPAFAAAGDKPKKQKPRQVHPTGEEDTRPATVEELQGEAAVEKATNRSAEGLVAVQHDNGMVTMDLEGRFMTVMVAQPAKNGRAGALCVHTREELAATRKATAAPTVTAPAPKAEPKTAPALEEK